MQNLLFKKTSAKSPHPAESVVAVDLGHSHIVVLELENKGKPTIKHLRSEARPENLEAVSEVLARMFKEERLESKKVRTVLKSQGTVIRILTFPQMKKSDFASAIRYEVEKYIPFKASEVILDFAIIKEGIQRGNSTFMETLLVAVKQSEIHDLIRIFQGAGLDLEVIDIGAFAFANALEALIPEIQQKTVGFIDMGAESSTLGVLGHGKPVFIRDVSFGGMDILKLVKRKLNLETEAVFSMQRNPAQSTTAYRGVVEQAVATFLNELKLSLGYYHDHVVGAEAIEVFYISGGGFRFIPDVGLFERELKVETRRPDFLDRIAVASSINRESLRQSDDLIATALGLCLR